MTASASPIRLPLDRPDAVSIASLYRKVQGALVTAFPRNRALWVRGEVQSIADRTGHCYLDLVDPDGPRDRPPVLKVKCWSRTWNPIKASLASQGVVLEVGTVVVIRGTVDFFAPKAEVNFILAEVDVAGLIGRQAATRAALVAALQGEGLLRRNQAVALLPVPLRIGLVASPGTEGCRDFLGQLAPSGLAFHVSLAAAQVQGSGAAASVVGGIRTVVAAGSDLVVVVRGGGSRADLVAFDAEPIARAIATAPVPVWTGIGHSGDQSVADMVAHRSFITPTECGQELVRHVEDWWRSVAEAGDTVTQLAEYVVGRAKDIDAAARARLSVATFNQLRRHGERLGNRAGVLLVQGPRHVAVSASSVAGRSERLLTCADAAIGRQAERVVSWRRLLAAYDVGRQLERGYTITLDENRRIVRSALALAPGASIVTRFADGSVRSEVSGVDDDMGA